ncbi:hypothetical protein [Streptomyces abikoensis]|uniref:Alpha/beta hydrolase n=1 Tax=Streptomyces abikoensis TaxID=97398 RepID=A0ABW7T4N2_9ACTN
MGIVGDTRTAPDTSEPDLVIFVHGTFAGDKKEQEVGGRWWQRDSEVWRWFEANLPAGAVLPAAERRLFQWSGKNTQVERLKASTKLLALLISLENEGRGYHLVGHSHGGSVIWEALVSSELARSRREIYASLLEKLADDGIVKYDARTAFGELADHLQLRGLRSWTTLGTPFLHFLPADQFMLPGIKRRSFSLFTRPSQDRRSLLSLFIWLAAFTAVAVIEQLCRRHTLSHFWDQGMWTGFPMLLVVFFGFLATNEGYALAQAYKKRAIAARQAMQTFHARWLGLWAPQDEAIALLQHVARFSQKHYQALAGGQPLVDEEGAFKGPLSRCWDPSRVALKKQRPGATLEAHYASRVGKAPLGWLITALYNKIGAPHVASIATNFVVSNIVQGNDLPKAEMAYCSRSPVPIDAIPEGLPERVARELHAGVSTTVRALGPQARELLIIGALDGELPAGATDDLRDQRSAALVHTSYFSHESVLHLIATHIRISRARAGHNTTGPLPRDDAYRWVSRTKRTNAHAWEEHLRQTAR